VLNRYVLSNQETETGMARMARRTGTSLVAAVLAALLVCASASAATPRYVGPAVASSADAPYTVLILLPSGYCTGSILDASRVLTAGHCVYDTNNQVLPPSMFLVSAGTNQFVSKSAPPDYEARLVASVRVHPAYNPAVGGAGDVAILQLTRPLTFNGSVGAIPLIDVGPAPATGSIVRGYGWGIQSTDGAEDGYEHSLADLTVRAASTCSAGVAGIFCLQSPTGEACHGDSGGPIVSASGQLVGAVSYGVSVTCQANNVDAMVDLAAPAIALWLRGNDNPPAMPFTDKPATLTPPPLTGGAATCTPPTWTSSPTLTTVFFQTADGAVVQDGPSNTYVPRPADVGKTLGCRSHAQTAGGTADMPAGGTIAVQAASLSVRPAKKTASISYTGPEDLPLKVTIVRGGHTAWTKTTASRRVALPSSLRSGIYRLCVDAPAAGQFASGQSCNPWRARGKKRRG
jgi:hypothetical protein